MVINVFGKVKGDREEGLRTVPVLTVHTIQREYEPIQSLVANASDNKIKQRDIHQVLIDDLGRQGAEIGADAVIGLIFHSHGVAAIMSAVGTAIKYKTEA